MTLEFFIAIPLIILALINFSVYRSVRLLATPQDLIEEVENIDDEDFTSQKNTFSNWCEENEFSYKKTFLFYGIINGPPIKCAAWWSKLDRTWALIYVAPTGTYVDFVTTFDNGIGVTTASTKDAFTLPHAPSSFNQAFTKISNFERYNLHKEAVQSIKNKYQYTQNDDSPELFHLICESILKQVAYINELPFWYLRGSYWFFVSRSLNVNKKIIA